MGLESPRHMMVGKRRRDKGLFNRLGGKEKSMSAHSESRYQSSRSRRMEQIPRNRYHEGTYSRRMKPLSESEDSGGGHWKSRSKKKKSSIKEDDLHIKGAPECMRISGFMHEITNPELIKRLHDNILKSIDEMMRSRSNKKLGENKILKKEETSRINRPERRRDKLTLLTKSPREILALDKGKFKISSPMTTPVKKRNNNKLCEFHGEVGHNTDECMHMRRHIEELIKAGKLSHVIKELKQSNRKDQPKAAKKGEASEKEIL
uniref:Reverse transcriptase domain-containing protein n=1 Tax=Tanacetum cinerariifolium TaxID=118510 RepID=A0A6L2LDS9_TANCI|nr:reverse transcriptase domain-containing protein [Tanacetum cinerariifolium]